MNEPKYARTATGFLMVLTEGDDLFAELARLARAEDVPSASLTAFGFAGSVTFGFFDFERRDYDPATFRDREMTGIVGTLAWKDGEPSLHAHGVGGGKDFSVVGGHLLALTVGKGSLEVTLTVHGQRLERKEDPAIGAKVLRLPAP
ncbi:PPC domain-containing DNA-binding protein [uncultured Massilia sp.]|uniref:PPC domain-containing DNA-binding protein n=1 Tax=uncultured Massilia sp. TaxID=169973 RepID=UPI0025D48E57|nr:PPC domain-containing DNA-binding protein [uncultured Massilia sp.]